ncbi:S-Ena type endospore appendage [Vallitalea okinawensis]|uniref:S-Ena type endospore appendage n=1 Tax=Vallitalea okinawensis TaxID=2078660 RepID=UPI000CFB32CA|nr:S-Ena type endospore appendage [Vallitalea okinawensis]
MSCCLSNERQILNTCFQNQKYTLNCTNDADDLTLLWEADGLFNPSGTFIITIVKACFQVRLFVNDDEVELDNSIQEGDTLAFTFDPLEKIEARCTGSLVDGCEILLSLSVNYDA